MLKIICFLGNVKIDRLDIRDIGADALKAMDDKNSMDVSPVTNALAYVQIFKDSVPALLSLGTGLVKLGERRTEATLRLAEKKLETELKMADQVELAKLNPDIQEVK